MEENKQQFNLSDFGVSEEEAKKQYSLSDFGVTEEEMKTLPSGVDATMTVGGKPEVKIEPTKDIHTQFKETLDKGLEAINSKFDKSIKTISEDNTIDADIKDTMLKNLEYKKKQAEDNMYIENAKKLKSMGVNPIMEKQDKPLETPDISPEFAIGGALGKFGAVPSVIGDVGATVATKGFEGITDMLTPKLKEDNPILYTVLGLASAIAGGSVANPAVEKTLQKGSDIVAGTGEFAYNAYKDPMFVKNILSGTATDTQSLDYLIKRSGETEDSIANIYNQYGKAKGIDADELSNADKVKAILANTSVGTRVKLDAEFYGEGVLAKQNTVDEKLRGIFKEQTAKGDYDIPALELKQYLNDSSGLYGSAKDALVKYSNNNIKVSPESVNELEKSLTKGLYSADNVSTVNNIIKDLRNPNGLDVEQLLEMKKTLNGLNLTSTKGFKAGTVGDFIDGEVKKSLGKDAYHLWEEVNKRYAAKKLIEEDNEIGQLLMAKADGVYSDKTFGEKILNIEKNGYQKFNMLRDAIGEKEATKVELGIVKSLLDSKMDMSKVIDQVERYGFSTAEGRSLLDNLDKVKGMVSDTDAKGLLAKVTNKRVGSVGWSDDLVAKLRYSIVGQLWNNIVKRLPSGSDERALDNIGKIIKEDTADITFKINKDELYDSAFKARERDLKLRVKALEQQGANRTAAENKELMKAKGEIATINDALDNMPKMIEYKPTNFITTKSGVSIPKSMEQDVETIKTAEKLGREANLRSQGRTSYNPKGEFQDTKVEPKKPVEVEILNENKNVPSTELAKPKEDIIDTEATRNYTKSTDGYYYDEFGNRYNNPNDIPSSTTPLPTAIENKSSAKKPLDTTSKTEAVNTSAYKEDIIQESYAKGFKSSNDIIDEKMKGKEVIAVDKKPIQNKPKGLTEEQSVRYESIMKDEIEPIRKEIERVGRAMNQVGKQNTTASKKKEMLKDYEVQLRKLNADLVTANKKLPKK